MVPKQKNAAAPRSDATSLTLQTFMPYRLAVVARKISSSLARKYAEEFGISIPEWRVIAHLGETPMCSSGELGARTAMDKAKVNRAVTRLVAAGLVLAQTSKEDARLNVLTLSRRGRSIYDRIVPIALKTEADLHDALSPDEIALLTSILAKLESRVEENG